RVVEDDLGLVLHRAVEGAKVRLSSRDADRVTLDAIELDLAVERASFEDWIAEDLAAIDRVLDDVLARAAVAVGEIDERSESGGRGPAGSAGGEGARPLSIDRVF